MGWRGEPGTHLRRQRLTICQHDRDGDTRDHRPQTATAHRMTTDTSEIRRESPRRDTGSSDKWRWRTRASRPRSGLSARHGEAPHAERGTPVPKRRVATATASWRGKDNLASLLRRVIQPVFSFTKQVIRSNDMQR